MTLRKLGFALLWSCVFAVNAKANTPAPDEVPALTATARLSPSELHPFQIAELIFEVQLRPGYKAYEDQFKISIQQPEGFKISKLEIKPLVEFYDKISKKNRKGLQKTGTIRAVIEAPEHIPAQLHDLEIQLTYQACTDTFCLFPQNVKLKVPFQFIGLQESIKPSEDSSADGLTGMLEKGIFWAFLMVFLGGILSSFTPCIFPMIPITLSVLGQHAHTRTRAQNFFVSLMYVLGIAVTYSIMGVVAASTGALFGHFMAHPLVLGTMSLIFFAMALSMFGLFELQAPAFIQNRFASSEDLNGYSGAFLNGIIAGVVASPCVGPLLVGILTYIAKTQNLPLGFALMFVYALGLGQIFLVLGLFSQLIKLLPKSGPWLLGVKNIFGVLMLGVGFYYLELLLPQRYWDGLLGLVLIIYGGYFGAFTAAITSWQRIRKGLYQACILLGTFFVVVGLFDLRPVLQPRFISDSATSAKTASNWGKYSDEALRKAAADGLPVIVDFTAEWCAACQEMDQFTFSEEKFKLLGQQFVLLKFDATQESPELDALREKYGIVGLPSFLFFDRKGQWLKQLTLTQFEAVDPFVARMKRALTAAD